MAKTGLLNARIDLDRKIKAEKVLDKVGVSASQAITMFYKQIVLRKGLPFDVRVPNPETVAALKEVATGGGQIVNTSTEDAFDEITGE